MSEHSHPLLIFNARKRTGIADLEAIKTKIQAMGKYRPDTVEDLKLIVSALDLIAVKLNLIGHIPPIGQQKQSLPNKIKNEVVIKND